MNSEEQINDLIEKTIELYNSTLPNIVTRMSMLRSQVDVNNFKKYISEKNFPEALSILDSYSFLKDQQKALGGENNPNYKKLLDNFDQLKLYVNELNNN
jgi:hypothetical protein